MAGRILRTIGFGSSDLSFPPQGGGGSPIIRVPDMATAQFLGMLPTGEVVDPEEQIEPLFFSDHREAPLGISNLSATDNSKWGLNNHERAECVTQAAINAIASGWPSHRGLRFFVGPTNGDQVTIINRSGLGTIGVGVVRNYRLYFVMREPDYALDRGQHPFQDGGAVSQSNWFFSTRNGGSGLNAATEWGLDFQFSGASFGPDRFTLGAEEEAYTPLPKGVVLRHEMQVVRISTTHFRFHSWVFNAAGTQLYSDADFHSRDGSLSLADNPSIPFNIVANTGTWVCGHNGLGPPAGNSSAANLELNIQGCFAVAEVLEEGQPIGPYGRCVGEVLP